MPTISYFEIPADDTERAKSFYSELFGWKIEKTEESTEYCLITTTDKKDQKGIQGGLMKRQRPGQPIINFIDVPSVEEFSDKVVRLGGKVVIPRRLVPDWGYFALCLDSENNRFAIWERIEKNT